MTTTAVAYFALLAGSLAASMGAIVVMARTEPRSTTLWPTIGWAVFLLLLALAFLLFAAGILRGQR